MARVKWNENNLAEIEANKPVRQKITEPKTPYHPMIDDDDDDDSSSPSRRGGLRNHFEDAMDREAVSSSLNDIGASSKTHHSGWTSSDDDADAMAQGEEEEEDSESEKHRSFKEQRKGHYDEFLKIKELRRSGSHLEEESDDDSSISAGAKDIGIKDSLAPANGF